MAFWRECILFFIIMSHQSVLSAEWPLSVNIARLTTVCMIHVGYYCNRLSGFRNISTRISDLVHWSLILLCVYSHVYISQLLIKLKPFCMIVIIIRATFSLRIKKSKTL